MNIAEQSFTPSLPKLLGVEVELVVGNPGEAEDELTLTIVDANNKELAVVTKQVQAANSERVMFLMPTDGVELSPGQTYRLRLTGGATFGWKYVVGGYENGEATFNGKPLLPGARSTFLFRTFGEQQCVWHYRRSPSTSPNEWTASPDFLKIPVPRTVSRTCKYTQLA